jgi:hypothetical protein
MTPPAGHGDAVADGIADLTPELLSAALHRDVVAVEASPLGAGQMGSTHRLRLRYGPGAPGPERLVAKLAAADPARRGLVADGYRKEVGFYRHIAPTVDVATPACWYSAIGDDGTVFTLLLDDLSPAGTLPQVAGCTVELAESALRNVAGLHAPRWNDPALADHDFLAFTDEGAAAFLGALHVDATEQFVARYEGDLDAGDVATLRQAAGATAAWLTTRPEPFSVVHGDYRLDNITFHPDGPTAAVDWQTLTLAPPARDVAYFLGTSVDPALRRECERRLVAVYHGELVARGVEGYDAGRCFDDYRLGHLHGPLITVLGSEFATTTTRTPEADAMFLAMAHRTCTAIRDLSTLALVTPT